MHSIFSKTAVEIKKTKQLLGDELTQLILAMHVFCGCNTTLGLHSVRSRTVLQDFLNNQEFRILLRIFSFPSSDKKERLQAEEQTLLPLLRGKREKTLDDLR